MRPLVAAALALSLAGPVLAADQSYQAQGVLVPFGAPLDYQTYGYMEVWGRGSPSPYANPATDPGDPFNYLIASSDAASAAALAGYTSATAGFGYDASASPYFISANGRGARYATGPISVGVTGAGLSPVNLGEVDASLFVVHSLNGHNQNVIFSGTTPTVDGPIPGSTFAYHAPSAATFQVDLVTLLGPSAYYVSGFNLSGFSTLPIRLTTPTEFRPVGISIQFGRFDAGGSFDSTPPAAMNLADWNAGANIYVYFDGVYGVAVNAADYASNDAYLAASSWVDANLRQINFEQEVSYGVATLTPVPEPTAAWLLMVGLLPVLVLARRRIAA